MNDINNKFDEAISLGKSGDFNKALNIFYLLLEDNPDNVDIFYNLGITLNECQSFTESEKYLTKLIEIEPNYKNAKVALGYSLINQGKNEKAERVLLKALEADPENVFALRNVGAIYGKNGDFVKALKYFHEAERNEPESRPILYGIAIAYFHLNKLDDAITYVNKVLNQNISDEYSELARTLSTQISEKSFKKTGIRLDAVFYCLAALEEFENLNITQIQGIVSEIALLGSSGLDPSNPEKRYHLNSLPGEFTGLQLLSYMYVGFKIIDPEIDIGFDLAKEYATAKTLQKKNRGLN